MHVHVHVHVQLNLWAKEGFSDKLERAPGSTASSARWSAGLATPVAAATRGGSKLAACLENVVPFWFSNACLVRAYHIYPLKWR